MGTVRMAVVAAMFMALAVAAPAAESGVDIQELQARLAAQEARMADQDARLNDLQAKIAGGMAADVGEASAADVVSLRKNAKVTVGGQLVTKYTYTDAGSDGRDTGERTTDWRTGDFGVTSAYLDIQVDVNEHFDAFASFDMLNGGNSDYYNAEVYYVRWKNLCETGIGLKIGRDALVFGDDGVGELSSYAAGSGDGLGETDIGVPLHNGWDISGVTQITPYWEGMDGKLSLELSLIQNVYEGDAVYASVLEDGGFDNVGAGMYKRGNKWRSRNYGLGAMSARARYAPIEDLNFTVSFANYRSNGNNEIDNHSRDWEFSKNNTVYGIAVNYRPAFLNRLYLWAQWVHGRNVSFLDDLKSHAFNFGASFDLTENLTWFAQGDYLRSRGRDMRDSVWAFYTGLQYSLPYGAYMELGWKHEWADYRNNEKNGKGRANTVYGLVGFDF